MLQYKNFEVSGKQYVKAYSDTGMYLRSGNMLCSDAFFPEEENLKFIESRIPIGSFNKNLKGEKNWVNLRR